MIIHQHTSTIARDVGPGAIGVANAARIGVKVAQEKKRLYYVPGHVAKSSEPGGTLQAASITLCDCGVGARRPCDLDVAVCGHGCTRTDSKAVDGANPLPENVAVANTTIT